MERSRKALAAAEPERDHAWEGHVIDRGTPDLIAQTAHLPADAGPLELKRAIRDRHARQAINDLVAGHVKIGSMGTSPLVPHVQS